MSRSSFSAVTTEGGLLPQDMLARIQSGDTDLPGTKPETYHLAPHERVGEVVNRAWTRLLAAWRSFQEALAKEPEKSVATGVTRDRWLLPLFQELGYGRLPRGTAITVDGKSYAVSHNWHCSPIHLLGCGVDLDRRQKGVAGASSASPHGLVQDFLNRSEDHLWGFLSNGYQLRLLRDHHSLTRQAYVEFDLQAIMDGEQYSEFLLLWLVCHQSRVEAENPDDCWLETWVSVSREEGVRALDQLRNGVEKAIEAFGTGFLVHKANERLREAFESGELDKQVYYRQLLRLVYRLIFLFVAEERDALLDPSTPEAARNRYSAFYSTRRIRDLADRKRGGPHGDVWRGVVFLMGRLHDGEQALGLPALGSWLWGAAACSWLMGAECGNEHVLTAFRQLSHIQEGKTRYPVNWRNVGADELGSIYESLLERHPRIHKEAAHFELETAAGNDRKTTGSYYTATSLVSSLLDTALDSVLDEAAKKPDAQQAILDLKICDPACGSGHFLTAAARRIAKRLAAVRSGDDEPSPRDVQVALRDVVGHCVYGVDLNPDAVELCKVSLWMEAIDPGKPLSFLDSHIQCGNALLGATPALMSFGVPDDAFKPIPGDNKDVAKRLRSRNRDERKGQGTLFGQIDAGAASAYKAVADQAARLDRAADDSINALREKERGWEQLSHSPEFKAAWFRADAWCAAHVWPKQPDQLEGAAVTHYAWRQIEKDVSAVGEATRRTVDQLAKDHRFFHWHLAFPQVFGGAKPRFEEHDTSGWTGGFDVMLGNPPWDEIQFEETAWFASRDEEVAGAKTAAERGKLIKSLSVTNPRLSSLYDKAVRHVDEVKTFVRHSGLYPDGAHGKLNTYVLFTEANARIVSDRGRVGCIVPTGLGTDKSTGCLFKSLMAPGRVISLYDFVNTKLLFPDVRPHQHFCLLTLGPPRRSDRAARLAAFLLDPGDLAHTERLYELSWSDVVDLSPETPSLPLFPSISHAVVFRKLATVFQVLGSHSAHGEWCAEYQQGTFNTATASDLFRTHEQLRADGYAIDEMSAIGADKYVPLFDAKMARQYSWRAASVGFSGHQFRKVSKSVTPQDELANPQFVPTPTYWVPASEAYSRLGSWDRDWILGFKDVTGTTSTRMAAFAVIPRWGVADKFPILRVDGGALEHGVMLSWMNSVLVEFVLRQRMQGVSLTWHLLRQIPTPKRALADSPCPWDGSKKFSEWCAPRVAELSVTSWSLVSFAKELGVSAHPFRFVSERRVQMQCEIDAAWCTLAGMEGSEVEFVLDYLDKIRASDERRYGDYRTKLVICEVFKSMQRAIETGEPYQTILAPAPADPGVAHPASTRPYWAQASR